MFIFDDLVTSIHEINNKYDFKKLDVNLSKPFKENENQLIFASEKAYELGGGQYKGMTLDLLSDTSFDDEILLLGKDLPSISKDGNYARISIASINKDAMGTANSLYGNIRKFDYVKYHFAYDGVMVRESAFNKKESLLVSKDAIKKDQLDFSKLGSYFISKYKNLPFIKNVKIIFIDVDEYDYEGLSSIVNKCENITKALDHLSNKVKMDCHSCALQVVCEEVEKKVKEDFK